MKGKKLKVVAINGSPSKEFGHTALILNPFLEGLRAGGAEVSTYNTIDLKIAPCKGGFDCWFKHPGECALKDRISKIYNEMIEADVWVLASPVFASGVSGTLKMFMDRMIATIEPFFELTE